MGLVQVATSTLTSSASTIAVNGIDDDSVYMLACHNLIPDSTNAELKIRVNKSSSAQSDSEYDYAFKILSTSSFNTRTGTNQDEVYFIDNIHTYGGNAIAYLYNFNSSSEYSFGTVESVANVSNQQLGNTGGWVHTVASASNGVTLHLNTGSFNSGTVTLYKVI
tara:strand:- start:1309 stop:1800 length:492 start_codon:yes stop_codon:yes gene_type:complete